jgi:hypothetical protein
MVMVMISIVTVIIVKLAIRMNNLENDIFIGELFEVPIDGGQPHTDKASFQPFPDVFRAKVRFFFCEYVEDGESFRCCL